MAKQPGTALAAQTISPPVQVQGDSLGELMHFCKEIGPAVAIITGCSPPAGPAIAWICRKRGMDPIEFNASFHLIGGKPSPKATSLLSDYVAKAGGKFIVEASTDKIAKITFTNPDGQVYPCEMTCMMLMQARWPWMAEDSRKGYEQPGWRKATAKVRELKAQGKSEDEIFTIMAPHFKDNYGTETDWRNMLFARLIGETLRSICPQVTKGIYTAEEMADVIDGELVSEQVTSPKAADIASQLAEQAQAAGEQVIDGLAGGSTDEAVAQSAAADITSGGATAEDDSIEAPFELTPTVDPGVQKAVDVLVGLYRDAFEEQADDVMKKSCVDRGVQHLHEIPAATRNEMATKLRNYIREQKSAQGND